MKQLKTQKQRNKIKPSEKEQGSAKGKPLRFNCFQFFHNPLQPDKVIRFCDRLCPAVIIFGNSVFGKVMIRIR